MCLLYVVQEFCYVHHELRDKKGAADAGQGAGAPNQGRQGVLNMILLLLC